MCEAVEPQILGAEILFWWSLPEGDRYLIKSGTEALHNGSAYDGSAYDGSAYDGSAYDGSAYDGSTYDGSAYDGSTTEVLYKSSVQSFV